ncbi:MAG: NTPase [Candidatus Methanosuratincola sp.]|jgi:nucleoside-triphosphatase|nr:NTPase [Candidatus Methanosuratincola sp.]
MSGLKRVFLLTGPPGIGKTTVLLRAVELLRRRGFSVGGIATREVRDRATGARVGFEILDLSSGRSGWLARASQGPGPRVGRYLVDLASLDAVGASAVLEGAARSDVVAVDEVGPMELLSQRFRGAVEAALGSGKPMVATVHFRSEDPAILKLKGREDAEVFVVSVENRDSLPGTVALRVSALLI